MSMAPDAPAWGGLVVVGCGLIGSSLIRAARRAWPDVPVAVVETNAHARTHIEALGLGDVVVGHPAALEPFLERAQGGVVAAICTPPSAISDATAVLAQCLGPRDVVFDVGSVKAPVVQAFRVLASPQAPQLVPAHPIAGTERSGPEAGFASLFDGRWCILTPQSDLADASGIARVEAFWLGCGARVAHMPPDDHDALLASTSHVPHLIAYALTATAQDPGSAAPREAMVRYSASGFRDFTRIAASDPVMWRDVFLANREAVLAGLETFAHRLESLRALVEAGDGAGLQETFEKTRLVRQAIVEAGQETPAPDFGRIATNEPPA